MSGVGALPILHRINHAQEGLLEQVIGQSTVFHHAHDVSENLVLVALHELSEGAFIAILQVGCNQFFVGGSHARVGSARDRSPDGDVAWDDANAPSSTIIVSPAKSCASEWSLTEAWV